MLVNLIISVTILFLAGALLIAGTHKYYACPADKIRADWLKFAIYLAIIIGFLAAALAGKLILTCVFMLVALSGAYELSKCGNMRSHPPILNFIISAAVIFIGLIHLTLLTEKNWAYNFAYVFLLVSITDSYSQLWGRLIGRHKLWPKVSPNKTWEGFLGGLITAVIISIFLAEYIIPYQTLNAVTYGLAIALASTAGDLVFSLIKRNYRIKDFSKMIPGHGGVLDRFDSLIVAAPVSYWLQNWLLK